MTKKFNYNVDIHFPEGWDTYAVTADCIDNARYNAITRIIKEISEEYAETIDCIRVFKQESDTCLKEFNI